MSQQVEFYFDYGSPYSFFAWLRVKEMHENGELILKPKPVLFAGLLNHWGQLGQAEIPPKRIHVIRQCIRYAKLHDIPFRGPQKHPFNTLTALRVTLLFDNNLGSQIQVIDKLYRTAWTDGGDLGTPNEVARCLDALGHDGNKLVETSSERTMKEVLKRRCTEAIARGVFGVPSMLVDNEVFWGNDDVDHLKIYLEGNDPIDEELVSSMLSRPRATDRQQAKENFERLNGQVA